MDTNPYASPTACPSKHDAAPIGETPKKRRFRWRVIPVTLMYFYGCAWVLAAVTQTLRHLSKANTALYAELQIGLMLWEAGIFLAGGCCWIVAATAFLKGRWRLGTLVTALALVVTILASMSYES